MTTTKISRKEMLKKPDEFITLTSRGIDFVKGHQRLFDYLGIAVLAIIIIYMGGYAYMKYVNKKGKEAYDTAYYALVKNTSTAQADLKKNEDAFEKVASDHSNSKAAKLAGPQIASLKFSQKQYDAAVTGYEQYLNNASEDDPYRSLSLLSLSTCYEQKGEYEKAITSLEKVIEGPDDFIKEQAMLGLARVYRLSGKQDKSNETLKQFKEKFPKSAFIDLAGALQNS